jgi:hypothetical protein
MNATTEALHPRAGRVEVTAEKRDRLVRAGRRAVEWGRRSPWLPVSAVAAIAWASTSPWGNFGLNDDWVYAEIAKHFADTGSFRIIPTAASAMGSAILALPILRLFGFSHLYLRLFSMAVSVAGLWAFDRLLAHVVKSASLRAMALLLLVFNPLYFYSSTTYMTEIHGWIPSLLAAVLWFWDRRRVEERGDPNAAAASWWVVVVVGAITASTFWTRQWCVLMFPAVVGATLCRLALGRRWMALLRTLPGLVAGAVVFAVIVYSFFPWARATGNLRPEFVKQIPNITKFSRDVFVMEAGAALVYMAVFFMPLLVLVPRPARRRVRWAQGLVGVALLALALYARTQLEATAAPDARFETWTHQTFPYVVNIIHDAGIGPVTFDDVFTYNVPRPAWPKGVWQSLEVLFVVGTFWWGAAVTSWARGVRPRRGETRFEVVLFGVLLTMGCLVAALQVYKGEINDRYYVPLILGLTVAVPGALRDVPARAGQWLAFVALTLPLAWFSIAGVHDEFRWQAARWKLIASALRRGATHATLESGWEDNCWWRYEELTREPTSCEGGCYCVRPGFCCVDDRWRLGLSVQPGYHAVESIQPTYWLASGPPVVLSRRF